MQDEEIPFGYVYRITNKINGKTYVGQRKLCRDTSWRQYMGSGKLVIQAIKKYGEENFVKSLIHYAYSRVELDSLEHFAILKESSSGRSEYNLATFTPNPEAWLNSNPAKLTMIRLKRSNSLKAWLASNKSASIIAAEKRYKLFCKEYSDKVLKLYIEMKSVSKVAQELNVSRKYVSKLLVQHNVEKNHRDVIGVKHTDETLNKISSSHFDRNSKLINKKCSNCLSSLTTKQQVSLMICSECYQNLVTEKKTIQDELIESVTPTVIELYEKGESLREIIRRTSIPIKTLRKILEIQGLPIPEQNTAKARDTVKRNIEAKNKDSIKLALDLYHSGYQTDEILSEVQISSKTLYRVLKENNLESPRTKNKIQTESPVSAKCYADARSVASISAAHTRWHVKRDMFNENCSLCVADRDTKLSA